MRVFDFAKPLLGEKMITHWFIFTSDVSFLGMYSMNVFARLPHKEKERHAMSWRIYSPPASPVNTINGFSA